MNKQEERKYRKYLKKIRNRLKRISAPETKEEIQMAEKGEEAREKAIRDKK